MTESSPEPAVRLDDLISYVASQHPGADALQQLEDAVATSTYLGEVSDHLIGFFVDKARNAGATWTDIGQHMGVTKQAAQKRFVAKESEEIDYPKWGMFSRFTPRARKVVAAARQSAAELGHDEVTNEHILLGLISETDGLAAQAIVELGRPLIEVHAAVLARLAANEKSKHRIRFGRGPKKTLELALREALHFGHNYIGTEHILLGLLRTKSDPAAQYLAGIGVTDETVRDWLVAALEDLMGRKR